MKDNLAERSKAVVSGTIPKGRGFESLNCQKIFFLSLFLSRINNIIYEFMMLIYVIPFINTINNIAEINNFFRNTYFLYNLEIDLIISKVAEKYPFEKSIF